MKIGVIGSGTMGSGIAQIAASHDCQTYLFDINPDALSKSKAKLEKILARLIEKGRLDDEKSQAIQNNIRYTSDLNAFKECDLVVEAIVENPSVKKSVFQELEGIVSDECIIASNTSSLSITSLAASLKMPERFIGIHFFNPAPLMKLVEIIPAIQTSDEIRDRAKALIDAWGKETVIVKDTPGFIVNKVARPFYSESLKIYEEGLASFATIDWALTELGGFRMGPFTLMDFIGNDVNYTVTETVFKEFYYDSRYKPAFTQKRLSEAGYHGKKSGRGYYNYKEGAVNPSAVEDKALGTMIKDRVVIMLINEAADTLFTNIASRDDIDTAMAKGVNYPKGLLAWADEIGIANCVAQMDALYNEYHEDRYRCCPLLRQMMREEKTFY